jgi:hypothetical protein
VRAAPNRETATPAVENVPRTAMTRSVVWTRGEKRRGACDARVAVGRGERGREREGSAARRPTPFETEVGEAGEEWGSWVWCRVGRHGTDAAAPGRSDNGGRCTPRGRGGRAANRGGGGVRATRARRLTSRAGHRALAGGLLLKRIQNSLNFD